MTRKSSFLVSQMVSPTAYIPRIDPVYASPGLCLYTGLPSLLNEGIIVTPGTLIRRPTKQYSLVDTSGPRASSKVQVRYSLEVADDIGHSILVARHA